MKKLGILNSEIGKVLLDLGHTDQICIADAGLPIANHTKKIDLALSKGLPSFLAVLELVLDDMWIERVYLAEEIKIHNPEVLKRILELVPAEMVHFISHEQFKEQSKQSKAVIRTGEMTSYANIILQSNVHFTDGEA